jgi:hypothetical protein
MRWTTYNTTTHSLVIDTQGTCFFMRKIAICLSGFETLNQYW